MKTIAEMTIKEFNEYKNKPINEIFDIKKEIDLSKKNK